MKNKYLKPRVFKITIEQEDGIATTSFSTVSFGESSNPYNPEVTDWTSEDLGTGKFEL